MNNLKKLGLLLVAATLLATPGCRIVDVPEGYVELDSPPWPYDVKAVSPDDYRFTVRVVANEGDGSLDFWVKSVRNQLERNKGYELLTSRDESTGSGLAGKELLFETTSKGVQYLYLVGIFPTTPSFLSRSKIYIVEAGGEKDGIEEDLESIRQAMRSVR